MSSFGSNSCIASVGLRRRPTAGRLPVRDTSRYYEKGATVAPATNGQRELPRKARWIDRKVIVALGTVLIRVVGQVLQNWIERGGHV
jgi:hypothetical protein